MKQILHLLHNFDGISKTWWGVGKSMDKASYDDDKFFLFYTFIGMYLYLADVSYFVLSY